jgi:hypothetical protein
MISGRLFTHRTPSVIRLFLCLTAVTSSPIVYPFHSTPSTEGMDTTKNQIQAPHAEVLEKTVYKDEADISHAERVLSADMDKNDHMDYDRVDKEVAKYTSDTKVEIGEEENTRL